ncbi:MAG: hypothetical protein AABW88_02990 [Nanoarchaeota archaeon]
MYEKVSFNEMWDFNENRELEGYYVGKKEDVGENHSNVYQVEADDGQVWDFWGATALDSQMNSVRLGSRIKIVYEGLKDSPKRKGKKYKDFSVFVDKELVKDFG